MPFLETQDHVHPQVLLFYIRAIQPMRAQEDLHLRSSTHTQAADHSGAYTILSAVAVAGL